MHGRFLLPKDEDILPVARVLQPVKKRRLLEAREEIQLQLPSHSSREQSCSEYSAQASQESME